MRTLFLGSLFCVLLGMTWMSFQGPTIPEICDNAMDDDGDGFIDLNDADCTCEVDGPVSLIPNASFEEFDCCPMMRSELDCARTWIQASAPTTDFIHQCGYMGWPNLPPPLPFPDGEGVVGYRNGRFIGGQTPQWKEYAGACLTAPLIRNQEYIIQFNVGFTNPRNSPPTSVAFFGTPDCINLPFGVENINVGCPANAVGWEQLGEIDVALDAGWLTAQIRLRPEQDIRAVAIGPNCDNLVSDVDVYYFLDQLLLDVPEAFNYQITFTGHPCQDNFTLKLPDNPTFDYQWYKDGIALVGEDKSFLTVNYGEGAYQARVDNGDHCVVTKAYSHTIPIFSTSILREICPGEIYLFNDQELNSGGTYFDTLQNIVGCDSIVRLRLKVLSEEADTLNAKIFDGETYWYNFNNFNEAGEYFLTEPTDKGCERLIFLNLEYYEVYIPNVFSPNYDGINDHFTIWGGKDLERVLSLEIFDRWGSLIFINKFFNPNDPSEGWNGRMNGQILPRGVYIYRALVRMDDNEERQLTGDILLMN